MKIKSILLALSLLAFTSRRLQAMSQSRAEPIQYSPSQVNYADPGFAQHSHRPGEDHLRRIKTDARRAFQSGPPRGCPAHADYRVTFLGNQRASLDLDSVTVCNSSISGYSGKQLFAPSSRFQDGYGITHNISEKSGLCTFRSFRLSTQCDVCISKTANPVTCSTTFTSSTAIRRRQRQAVHQNRRLPQPLPLIMWNATREIFSAHARRAVSSAFADMVGKLSRTISRSSSSRWRPGSCDVAGSPPPQRRYSEEMFSSSLEILASVQNRICIAQAYLDDEE